MARVIITRKLEKQINKIFKKKSVKIFSLLLTLKDNPKKGKAVSAIGNIVIKELKHNKYRFYFISDKFKIKILSTNEIKDILIKFIRMSEKKDQQKTIDEIKAVLRSLGSEGF